MQNPPSDPKIHLKTRKSQPVSQKVRDDFYSYDSQPRFFIKKKIYLPEENRAASKSPSKTPPATFQRLFERTSPDGFLKRQKSPSRSPDKSKNPLCNTPKFRGKKKVPGFSPGTENKVVYSEEKAKEFEAYSQRTGKKVLRLDKDIASVDKVRAFYKKFCAYKNLSNVFPDQEKNPSGFVTEYGGNFRMPGNQAYRNEYSPFKNI